MNLLESQETTNDVHVQGPMVAHLLHGWYRGRKDESHEAAKRHGLTLKMQRAKPRQTMPPPMLGLQPPPAPNALRGKAAMEKHQNTKSG